MRYFLTHPLFLALALTLSNAAKPVVIDDTAYLLFARHLAAHPLDPYGFELFWYFRPEPAMEIILPPALPYWLAAGIAVGGEDPLWLKLWLYPVAAVLAYSARFLVGRFVGGTSPWPLVLLVVGPGVLPFFNFMLDVPAIALQLAAVALAVRGTDQPRRWGSLVLAGIFIGLALQTKYAVLGLPAVLLLVAVLRRAWVGVVPLAIGLTVFAGWELFLVSEYGRSHFLYHVTRKSAAGGGLLASIGHKLPLILPLMAHLGLTVGWVGLLGLARVVSPRVLWGIAGLLAVGAAVITFAPGRWTVLVPPAGPGRDPVAFADIYFRVVGGLAFAVAVRFAVLAAVRRRTWRAGWQTKFLLAWLVVELGTYFVVSPFPAGRRVLGVSVVVVLIAGRVWVRRARVEPRLRAAGWVFAAGLGVGVATAAVDAWDAVAERELPRFAAQAARDRGWTGTGYYTGHWGFQYYAEREGLRAVEPGRTRLRAGDWLLLPFAGDSREFFRPNGGGFVLEPAVLKVETLLVSDDWIAAQTIPPLYAGRTPVVGRTQPRLMMRMCRVTADWTPRPVPE